MSAGEPRSRSAAALVVEMLERIAAALERSAAAQERRNEMLARLGEIHEAAEIRARIVHELMTTPTRRFEDIVPQKTRAGTLCCLCDSMAGCSHPRRRCRECGAIGLAENMTDETHPSPCKVAS